MHPEKSIEKQAPAKSVNKPNILPSPPTFPDPIPENGSGEVSSASRLPEQEVDFAELEDGTLVEMVEDPNDRAKSLFAVYKNGTVQYAVNVEHKNRLLVPVPREQGIFKHVRLPRGCQAHESLILLLAGIMTLILECVDISQENAFLVAAFVLSTWFTEGLTVAPYLALLGPPGSGKTTLLKVLNLVCRRALLTADITSAAFYEVYEKLNPTLIVDETVSAGNRRELFHLLKTGTTRGSVTLRKSRSLKAFGPKVISFNDLPNDAALNSRCIIISMQETTRNDLLNPRDKKVLDLADDLQKQLQHYRLEKFNSLHLPKVEGDERLHSRTRDLYQALALPIGSNADLCGDLVRLFEKQEEINREPLSPASAAVLKVLYEFIHSHPMDGKCANKELALGVNLNLESLQETFRVNTHEVGRALTSLGLTNRKRTNVGFILWLDLETRKRIHKKARDHGIDQESRFHEEGFGNECDLCKNQEASTPASTETKEVRGSEKKKS